MRYIYGITDIKYKASKENEWGKKVEEVLPVYRDPSLFGLRATFDHNEFPAPFIVAPLTLLERCIMVVDQLPLPSVYTWTDNDIRCWIYRCGYPQYMNTFRVNMIWGRKLLLLDANALCAMNIKNFDHIKRITYGIRMLFHFELTKFSTSVSRRDENPHELYLLWHTQTGTNYDKVRCSDLLHRMQVIRERSRNLDHWDLLELWLRRERERKHTEIINNISKAVLYVCPKKPVEHVLEAKLEPTKCQTCIPPCTCLWTERDVQPPWRLQCLPPTGRTTMGLLNLHEHHCDSMPPCECCWRSKDYQTNTVLSCLKEKFCEKFAPSFMANCQMEISERMMVNWTRFSM